MMTDVTETDGLASRLHLSTTRLARILRQQSPAELTPTQLAALATVQRDGPLPIGTLASIEQVAAPTATKVVEKLHQSGLISRQPDPDDRRVSIVAITSGGADLLRELRARKTQWLAARIDELSDDERRVLTEAVEVLEAMMRPQP